MITAGRLASRWLACGSPIVNVPQSQRAGSGAGARLPASLMWCGSPRGSRTTSPRLTCWMCGSPSIRSTSSPSSMMCRVPISAKLIEKVRCGAYATIRSPLRRTLRSNSESKSCGWPFASRPSAASSGAGGSANSRGGRSKSAGVAGRSAKCSGGAVIVSTQFLGIRSTNSERSGQSDGLGAKFGRFFRRQLLPFAEQLRHRNSPDILVQVWVRSLASTVSNRTDVTRPERTQNP